MNQPLSSEAMKQLSSESNSIALQELILRSKTKIRERRERTIGERREWRNNDRLLDLGFHGESCREMRGVSRERGN